MKNKEVVVEALTRQFKMWREGKIVQQMEDGATQTIGILDQPTLTHEDLARSVVDIIGMIDAQEAKKLTEV
jgi:hypothetical protein